MKPIQLPNGFVLDLDSVHYIQSERFVKHPFVGAPIMNSIITIECDGNTKVEMDVPLEQAAEIKQIILNNLDERAKQ